MTDISCHIKKRVVVGLYVIQAKMSISHIQEESQIEIGKMYNQISFISEWVHFQGKQLFQPHVCLPSQ